MRIPIRIKLAAAVAVPLVALSVTTVVETVRTGVDVGEARRQAQLARVALAPGGLINRLQDERSWAAIQLPGADRMGVRVPVESYPRTRQATDVALRRVRSEVRAQGGAAEAAYAPVLDGLSALRLIRADIDANRATSPVTGTTQNTEFSNAIYARYSSVILPLFDATDRVAGLIEDDDLRRGAQLANLAGRDGELYVDTARHNLLLATLGARFDSRVEVALLRDREVQGNTYNAALAGAGPPYDAVVRSRWRRTAVAAFSAQIDRALAGEQPPVDELIAPLATDDWAGLRPLRAGLADAVTEAADRVRLDAQRREQVVLATAAASLVTAFGLALLVSRSITRPLRSLTHQAIDVADRRLPNAVRGVLDTPSGADVHLRPLPPVRVRTCDEVVDVAHALNTVQDTALGVAVEQSVLHRNIADSVHSLGRRHQNLVVRLLDVITELENRETDPNALANLFRIDHLATLMRRNAESLLLLAGTEAQRSWHQPVSVSDLVRAALSEVEDYQRVAVRGVEPALVVGSAAADVAHLLAELIENALEFSPPNRLVDVWGGLRHDGYLLAVVDNGVGMDAEALASANRRLAGAESFTVAPSTYIGHYLTGRLAARHGIGVHLGPSVDARGVTATVRLPVSLLEGAFHPPPQLASAVWRR